MVALVLSTLATPACGSSSDIAFDITLPKGLVQDTAWFEIGAFRDATCGALLPILAGGVPDGATTRVAFSRSDKESPRIGDIPTGSYAFGAVAKGKDCEVVA